MGAKSPNFLRGGCKLTGRMSPQRRSIRWRLFAVVFGATLFTLLLSGAGFYLFERHQTRRIAIDSASALAAAITRTLGAAVVFRDTKTAQELLAAFDVDADIQEARVLTSDGEVFASYRRPSHISPSDFPTTIDQKTLIEETQTLYISEPIVVSGETVGNLQLEYTLSHLSNLMREFRMFWGMVLIAGILFGALTAAWLAGLLAKPLLELARAMGRVSHEKNFSMRLEHSGDREIEQLYLGFNSMLEELGKRDQELRVHQETLEQRVTERTEELREEIRERQRAEDALLREQALLRSVIRNAPVAVAMLDMDLRFLVYSNKWLSDYKLGDASITGLAYADVFPNIPQRWRDTLGRALLGSPEECAEDSLEFSPGDPIYLRWAVHPWFQHNGQQGGIILATERIDDLVRARHEAVHNAELKTQFLTNISHELRTPLNGILGITELLLEEALDGEQRHALETVYGSGRILLSLINDLLDLSRLEAGRIELQLEPYEPRGVVQESVELITQTVRQKQISVHVEIGDEVPKILYGDSFRLKQVLLNLLGNAVKFTERGTITIRLDREPAADRLPLLHWSISDTGIGIPEEQLKNIFQPFTQADGSITRRFGGSGLGLAICDQIVRLLGGTLTVTSTPGNGSSFSFTLPELPGDALANGYDGTTANQVIPPIGSLNILVAEDNLVNQRVVATMLTRDGHQVTIVENGAEALSAVTSQQFDLVLMDLQMPVLSGVDATERIRLLADPAKRNIPIIALTAHAFDSERDRALSAGVSAYLTKPIDRAALRSTLYDFFGNAEERAIEAALASFENG